MNADLDWLEMKDCDKNPISEMCGYAKECIACSRFLQKLYSLSIIFYILTGTLRKCTSGLEKQLL